MELFESDQTNNGPYALKLVGDFAFFTFQQELRKNKDQKVGCCITLS